MDLGQGPVHRLGVRPSADGVEGLVGEELPIPEDLPHHVSWDAGPISTVAAIRLTHRLDSTAELILDEFQATALAVLARVRDGLLEDATPFAGDSSGTALEGELMGVPVHLLEQPAPHPEDDVLGAYAEACLHHRLTDFLDHVVGDPVSVNDAHLGVEDAVALGILGATEGLPEHLETLDGHLGRVAGVGPDHESPTTRHNPVVELDAEDILDSVVNIITVGYHRENRTFRALVEEVAVCFVFIRTAPDGRGAVLGCHHTVAADVGLVVFHRVLDAREGVRAQEVHEVGRAADASRFLARDSAVAEVVQAEGTDASAGEVAILRDEALDLPGESADADGIPDLHQKRLTEVRDERNFGIRVLHGHKHIPCGNDQTFGHSLDDDGDVAVVLLADVHPAGLIEVLVTEDLLAEVLGLGNHLGGDPHTHEVLLENRLETVEHRLLRHATSALQVGVNDLRLGRILHVVGFLVRVRS